MKGPSTWEPEEPETASTLDQTGEASGLLVTGAPALLLDDDIDAGTAVVLPRRVGTFAAFGAPAYRRFFIGQTVSLPGTWMQIVGQSWLVLEMTGSGTALGLLTAAQFLPVLLLSPYGGLLADRFPKRWLLVATQSTMCAAALVLGLLTVTHHVGLPAVVGAAVVLGLATAVDNPTRQSFVVEMVGPSLVRNAVSLNSVLINGARAVGPAIAGLMIAFVGIGWCFLANAISFSGILVALLTMKVASVRHRAGTQRVLHQLGDGLKYAVSQTNLLWPVITTLLVGTLAWEFPITLPMLARVTLDGDARTYGYLTSAMGVGAVISGLFVARRGAVGMLPIASSAALFGVAVGALAAAPTVWVALVALLFVGAGSTAFMSITNATMLLSSDNEHRGRVMSLWSISFSGTTPIGGPIVGAVAEDALTRWALALGAMACGIAAVAAWVVGRRTARPDKLVPSRG